MTTTTPFDATPNPSMAILGQKLHPCPSSNCNERHIGGLPLGSVPHSRWQPASDNPPTNLIKGRPYARCPEHGGFIYTGDSCPQCAI